MRPIASSLSVEAIIMSLLHLVHKNIPINKSPIKLPWYLAVVPQQNYWVLPRLYILLPPSQTSQHGRSSQQGFCMWLSDHTLTSISATQLV